MPGTVAGEYGEAPILRDIRLIKKTNVTDGQGKGLSLIQIEQRA
jgi:hypothetical protein